MRRQPLAARHVMAAERLQPGKIPARVDQAPTPPPTPVTNRPAPSAPWRGSPDLQRRLRSRRFLPHPFFQLGPAVIVLAQSVTEGAMQLRSLRLWVLAISLCFILLTQTRSASVPASQHSIHHHPAGERWGRLYAVGAFSIPDRFLSPRPRRSRRGLQFRWQTRRRHR